MKAFIYALGATALLTESFGEMIDQQKTESSCCCNYYCEPCIPYTGPYVCNGWDLILTADFIYWTARMSDIAFAVTNQEELDVATLDINRGRVLHPDWSIEPGFRVGLGTYVGCDGWRIYADYTWLRFDEGLQKPKLKEGQEIISSLGSPLIETMTSSGKFKFDFNVVDLEVGKTFCIDRCFILDAHFGLKTDWQTYRFLLRETGESRTTRNPGISHERFTSDTWAVGIRAGMSPRWYWSSCFSIFSSFAATAQWQHFDSKGKVTSEDLTAGRFTSLIDVEDCFYLVTPVLEAQLGLKWENWFCCDRYHFAASAGWEIQWWGRQNQFITFFTETRDGDLGLQGLTVSFEFDF